MRKTITIFALLLFCLPGFSQVVYEDVSNLGIYDFLDELANLKLITLNSAVKPYSRSYIAGKLHEANTTLAVKSKLVTIDGGAALSLKAILISLNGGPALPVSAPKGITTYTMPDTTFDNSTGWQVSPAGLESIVTRAPTHEPWPYHNQGVAVKVDLQKGKTTASPGAPSIPTGWSITAASAGTPLAGL